LSIFATDGVPPYQYRLNGGTWTALPVDGIVTGLRTGEYVVEVRDNASPQCTTASKAHIVSDASTLTIVDPVVISHTASGSSTGAISFKVTGMNSTYYTYQLNNMEKVTMTVEDVLIIITGLPAGEHILYVSDSCGWATETFIIRNTNCNMTFEPTVAHIQVHCDGITTTAGSIILTVSGGTGPYSYRYGSEWRAFATYNTNIDTIGGLPQGEYLVEVRDNTTGCTYAINRIEIRKEPAIPVSIGTVYAASEPDCDESGSIKIFATGGSGVYEFSVNGRPYQTYPNDSITGLSAGYYHIVARDTNNRTCATAEVEFELQNIGAALNITVTPGKADDCTSATGSLAVLATGGVTPYYYRLNGTGTWTELPVNGIIPELLPTGEYVVEVRDSDVPPCTTSSKAHITSDASTLEIDNFTIISHATCESSIGAITFTVNGMNNATYTYQLNNMEKVTMTDPGVVITIAGLSAGEHILYVSDTCGVAIETFVIENANSNLLFVPAVTHAQLHCDGLGTTKGQIVLTVSGGVEPYEYRYNSSTWTPFAAYNTNMDTIANLNQGEYLVEVRDANGCTYSINRVEIKREPAVQVSIGTVYAANEPNCDNSGSIQVFATGGSGVYEFSVNGAPYQTWPNDSITGLSAGYYHIVVRDTNNRTCATAEVEFELQNVGGALNITIAPSKAEDCTSNTGALSVLVTGGVTPYQYRLNGGATWLVLPDNGIIANLPTGEYVVEVRDNYSPRCTTSSKAHITSDASLLRIDDFVIISHATCESNIGAITFKVRGMNNATYTYQLNNMEKVTMSAEGVEITLTGLAAGEHVLYVSDTCGVDIKRFTIINTNSNLLFIPTVTHAQLHCDGITTTKGQIHIAVTGGVLPYEYRYNSGVWIPFVPATDTAIIIPNLNQGEYLVEVRDAGGCTYAINKIEIRRDPAIPVSIGTIYVASEPDCDNSGSIQVYPFGGSGAYEFSVNGSPYATYPNDSITGLSAGYYRIMVRDTNNRTCATAEIGFELGNIGGALNISVTPIQANDCTSATGKLAVTVTDGVAPYYYRLNGAGGWTQLTNDTIFNLRTGEYVVEIRDSDSPSCTTSVKAHITSGASTLEIDGFAVISHATCESNIGAITFKVTGMNSTTYTYQLNNMEKVTMSAEGVEITIAGLPAGEHVLYVSDSCGVATEIFTIENANSRLAFTIEQEDVHVDCDGGIIYGYIMLTVTGGVAPYQYRYTNDDNDWTSFTPANASIVTIPDLMQGDYRVEVMDASGCTFEMNKIAIGKVQECYVVLDLTVFLQGVTRPDSTMTNYIQVPTVPSIMPNLKLPVVNPYGLPGTYTHINNVAVAGPVVDWVVVEIWGNFAASGMFTAYDLIDRRALLLRSDGTVVDTTGQKPRYLPYDVSNVRIVVKHRSHMTVVSNAQLPFNTNATYNFSTGITQALKAPLAIYDPMIMQNGLSTMWAGDLNMNEFMDNVDMSIFNIDWRARPMGEYIASDVNMDGVINNMDNSFVTRNTKLGLYSPVYFFMKR